MGAPDWVDVWILLNNGDIPASYISLPEGSFFAKFHSVWRSNLKEDGKGGGQATFKN